MEAGASPGMLTLGKVVLKTSKGDVAHLVRCFLDGFRLPVNPRGIATFLFPILFGVMSPPAEAQQFPTESFEVTSPHAENGGSFAEYVVEAGDVDGDGTSDLLVGAPTRDVGGVDDAGKIYLFSGATGEILLTRTSPNPSKKGYFGYSLAVARDTEEGGPEAFCAGAFGESAGSVSGAGRFYCFSL